MADEPVPAAMPPKEWGVIATRSSEYMIRELQFGPFQERNEAERCATALASREDVQDVRIVEVNMFDYNSRWKRQ